MIIRRMIGVLTGFFLFAFASVGFTESWFPTWQSTPTPSPSQTADRSSFQFRGGVGWRMNPEEVKTRETGLQMEERSQGEWTVVYSVNRVEVSRFFADLVYIFRNQQLNMILYAFDPAESASSYFYLTEAIGKVYGERKQGEPLEVVSLMDRVYPGMYTSGSLSDVWVWQPESGTRIYLYRQAGSSFSILYASPDSWLTGSQDYVTTGL